MVHLKDLNMTDNSDNSLGAGRHHTDSGQVIQENLPKSFGP